MNPYIATILTFVIVLAFLRLMDHFAHRGWRCASRSYYVVRKNLFKRA